MQTKPLLLVCAISTILIGCGESSSQSQGSQFGSQPRDTNTDFNQTALLENIVDNVLLPGFEQFSQLSQSQNELIGSYCAALTDNQSSGDTFSQAQTGWQNAMNGWQQIEMMQIGPLADNSSALRNQIYSWPNVNTCSVDQEVMFSRQSGYNIQNRTNTRRGMDALEYLLFNDSLGHSCTIAGTEPQGWDALTDGEKTLYRCEFAKLVAEDVQNSAQQLVSVWQAYADTFKQAGNSGSEFATAHDAVNDVSDALFYADKQTKDAKLGVPLGLFENDCGSAICPENVESLFANQSVSHIKYNLMALKLLLQGGSEAETHIGFDDYLVDVGDPDTADKLIADLDAAIAMAEQFETSLADALSNEPQTAEALHGEVKKVTDTLKTDFINSLALELPATSAGDND